MDEGALARHRIVTFEARRSDELETMLRRHGADVFAAPALREAALPVGLEVRELADRLVRNAIDVLILLTGVGTRALAAALREVAPGSTPVFGAAVIIARGPKPLAALRDLGVSGAHPVASPFTWREVLAVADDLQLHAGQRIAVQEYGVPNRGLLDGLERRGLDVLRVPVYRWALPADVAPLQAGAERILRGDVDVAVFTNAAQVEHLFRVVGDPARLQTALTRVVVASVGPVCSEGLEAHGIAVDLEASPPKMGPLVAAIAKDATARLAAKRRAAGLTTDSNRR